MQSTTEFNEWLDHNIDMSDMDYNDIYALYSAVQGESSCGCFDVSTGNGNIFLKLINSDNAPLRIASPLAKDTFLQIIEERFCEGMNIEGYYSYHKAMEKDD